MLLNKISNTKTRTRIRVVLCSIVFAIVAVSFAGEKVAHNNGVGWDGENYLRSMQHFTTLIMDHGYNQYDIMRVMPWGLTNIICNIAGVEVTQDIAMASAFVYIIIALVLAILYFFRISDLKQWKLETEVLGFVFIFFSFPILKMLGYYPMLSDIFGMALGLIMCFYFFANRKWALILCGFIGAFIWPITPLLAFALAFFSRKPLSTLENTEKNWSKKLLQVLFVLIACIPLFLLVIGVFTHHGQIMPLMKGACSLMRPLTKWVIPFTCICSCLYYYYMVSSFKVSIPSALKENFTGKNIWINYGLFILCMAMTSGVCKALANSDPGAMTTYQAMQRVVFSSMAEPFVFIQDNFIYLGLGYLLALIFWRDICKIIMQQGLGFFFVVAIWVFFSIGLEARCAIQYWMFPLMALLIYIDTKNIRPIAVVAAGLFSLIHSRFWYPINVPNMEYYFSWENYEHFVDFPAQRYYMNFGHWQSHEMYAVWMVVTIIIGALLYWGIRKKWYVKEEID